MSETREPVTKRTRERMIDTGETQVQEPLPYQNTAKRTTDTVTVSCNLPNGLILTGWKWVEDREPGMKESARIARLDESLGTFKVNGNATAFGMPTSHLIGGINGYALTRGVPRALWENWLGFHKNSAMVVNHCIFAHEKASEAVAKARDNKGRESGLERIDPDNPGKKTGIRRIKKEEPPEKDTGNDYEEYDA